MATLASIRTAARIRADQDASTFPTDAQYTVLIDSSAKEVWFDLFQAGWPLKGASETITPSSQYTSLAATGVAFIKNVYRVEGGQYHELPRIQEGSRAALMSTQDRRGQAYQALITASGYSIEILPASAGYSYLVEYVAEYPGFSGESDTWYGPARSDELIVLKAAMKACRKEGNDQGAQFLAQEYAELKQTVQNMANWFNMRNAATIRDVGDPIRGNSVRLPGDYDVNGF